MTKRTVLSLINTAPELTRERALSYFYELVVASCGGAEAWDSNTGSFSIDPDYSLSVRLEQMGLPREAPCPQGACVLGLEGLDRACSMGLVASLDLVNLAAVMNSPSEIASVKAKLQHLAKDNASKAIPIYIYSHYVSSFYHIIPYYISIPIIVSSPHNVFLVQALHAAPLPPKVGRVEMGLVVLLEIGRKIQQIHR